MDSRIPGKPADVFDRDAEWADLADFALSPLPGLRIAVVYGRRRQGKSYLLRRLTSAVGGLYHLATEQAGPVSLRRFGDSLAAWSGLSAGAFGSGGWEQALRTATEAHTVESKILGPHFEALAAEWVARYAPGEAGPGRRPGRTDRHRLA